MRNRIVKFLRRILPKNFVTNLAKLYRHLRLSILNLRYGNPAKSLKAIAVTGTNGKTTTLCLINEILKSAGFKTALWTTALIEMNGVSRVNDLNLTVPNTSQMQAFLREAKQAGVDYVLLEATSQALDQNRLPRLNLEVALFTNLTQDHLDYHQNLDNYAYAKSRLWRMEPRFSIINGDSEWTDYFAQFNPRERLLTYGSKSSATLRIERAKLYKKGSEIDLEYNGKPLQVATALPGRFNAYNVAGAVATALALGISEEAIVEGLASLQSVSGRQQHIENELGLDILVDYAHTPDALEQLLTYAKSICKGKISLVFGACGDRDQEKRPIMGRLAGELADHVFVTDEENYSEDASIIRQMVLDGVKEIDPDLEKTLEIPDRQEAIRSALTSAKAGDMVLVTGLGHEQYRVMNNEKIAWNDASVIEEILKELK